jgi:branched-chain amino acid transport system ATP-binding protein
MSLLSVENVTMRFGGVTAVRDVSLSIEADCLLGFIGPNGAGKTTLMRIMTGVLRPQQGRVIFNNKDITAWPIYRRIGAGLALAQQIVRPLRSLNLIDNVALAVGVRRMHRPWQALLRTRRDEERDLARQFLDKVGIGDAANAKPDALPLGYLKRLEVARALALEPSLLLLDEPLAGLNQSEAHGMADLIASLAGNGRSVVLIEHNIREVARICPKLYVQDNGQALLHGETEEIMKDPELHRAYLGTGAD